MTIVLTAIVICAIALLVSSIGIGIARDHRDLMIVWAGGLSVFTLVAFLGPDDAQWPSILGWLIGVALSIYTVDRIFNS